MIDTLSSYSWARAVSACMNESLIAKAKAKKGGEASIGVVSGCTIEKGTPAILKWSLVELHTRFNQIKDLNDIEGIFKTPKKQKTTREVEGTVEKGILKTYKNRKTTRERETLLTRKKEDDEGQQGEVEDQGKPDDANQTPELKEAGKKKMFESEAGKEHLAIQDLLVKSMTDKINYANVKILASFAQKDYNCGRIKKMKAVRRKMKEFGIYLSKQKRDQRRWKRKCVTATMTVESTIQLHEIQNLKRRIAELEGKETSIDMEKIAKKKEIEEKYKVEIESLLSDPTIFEMEMDLPTT
ncbi:hypothetical protein Prudu_133S000400 [Prunus dulcis]|uniref:Uncharacterized protein n=1 Tax=Prunus dulcis TaxID=3755 RepID=A0A5H2XXN8_PRUDU|nr:hypothetical protein Prudu_133S000400 [Prunus dulcis]